MHDLAQAAELRTSVVKLRTSVAHSVKDICLELKCYGFKFHPRKLIFSALVKLSF